AGQPLALLLDRAEEADRTRAEALHGEGEIGERRMVGEGLARDGEAAHVGALVALRDAELEEAGGPERAHQSPAFAVEIVGTTAREIVGAPALQLITELAVPGLEERPGEVRTVNHLPLPGRDGPGVGASGAARCRGRSFLMGIEPIRQQPTPLSPPL